MRRVPGALRGVLATYLGAALDTYLVQVYLPGREDNPPPALISPRQSVARRYAQVQPEAIWDLFSQALDPAPALNRSQWLEVKTRIWGVMRLALVGLPRT